MPASVTYTFAPGQSVASAKFNTNFGDLVTYINDNCILKDASVAFTAVPSGPASDPSSDNQLARKKYVDDRTLGVLGSYSSTSNSSSFTGSASATGGTVTFTMPTLAAPRAVRIAVFLGQLRFNGTTNSDVALFQLRRNGTTVAAQSYFNVNNGFGQDYPGGHFFEYHIHDNTVWTAGSCNVQLWAQVPTGTGTILGLANTPWQITVTLV